MVNKMKNEKGFSLTEVVLTLVIASLIAAASSQTLFNNMDSYASIANRRSTVSDARHSMNQISSELRGLTTSEIQGVTATQINFADSNGSNTSFRLDTNGNTLAVYRGNDILLDRVNSFVLNYYNDQGQEINPDPQNIANIRRIKVSISAAPVSEEGQIALSTIITPRQFIGFANYQYQ